MAVDTLIPDLVVLSKDGRSAKSTLYVPIWLANYVLRLGIRYRRIVFIRDELQLRGVLEKLSRSDADGGVLAVWKAGDAYDGLEAFVPTAIRGSETRPAANDHKYAPVAWRLRHHCFEAHRAQPAGAL